MPIYVYICISFLFVVLETWCHCTFNTISPNFSLSYLSCDTHIISWLSVTLKSLCNYMFFVREVNWITEQVLQCNFNVWLLAMKEKIKYISIKEYEGW
jgi:hypothetical protein